ncbi:hypothetical protein LOK49_LG12G02136 [Camellia lanceoleosa]|uniref:Uncharacterized protein n=1 Tax=Camellia lanceoleosa TaxID=1840588 RepID=A0ACC0FNA7_9ERIC|nr:hypothetical protein LOK49_LG12G02136 [Camellia lanceoleosa]
MAVGVFLVIIILLFRTAAEIGLGDEIITNWEEKCFLPYSMWIGGIVVAGAALGYWIVRKFVISDDGSVDVGAAQFVKWAMRIIAATFIFQCDNALLAYLWTKRKSVCNLLCIPEFFVLIFCRSTLDTPLAMGALASCLSICFLFYHYFGNSIYSANGNPWRSRGRANVRHNGAEFLSMSGMVASRETLWNSPRRSFGWSDSPVKADISDQWEGDRNQQDYYSTFHRTPNRKKF